MTGAFTLVLTFAAALGGGVMAGLFFAFSVSVMPALGRRPPAEGIAAMQAINVAILNPSFFAVFFGTALLCVALAVVALLGWHGARGPWLLAGSLLYLAGGIGVTIAVNVPMNDALAAAQPDRAEAAALWARYLSRWTAWNHVRALACAAALIAFMMAALPG